MSKLFRALMISAVATGAAAVVLQLLKPAEPQAVPPPRRSSSPYVDADDLTDEQRDLLMQELDSQL